MWRRWQKKTTKKEKKKNKTQKKRDVNEERKKHVKKASSLIVWWCIYLLFFHPLFSNLTCIRFSCWRLVWRETHTHSYSQSLRLSSACQHLVFGLICNLLCTKDFKRDTWLPLYVGRVQNTWIHFMCACADTLYVFIWIVIYSSEEWDRERE